MEPEQPHALSTESLEVRLDVYIFVFAFFKGFFFFLMWTIFKVFIEFVTMLLLFYVLVFWLLDVGS